MRRFSGDAAGKLLCYTFLNFEHTETGDKGRLFAGTSGAASVERRVE